jgi:autophagy-related protein 17
VAHFAIMSSDSSSAPSPSPPASPEASVHREPPNLERLILHFVASKRSLASIAHVQHAGELVTNSRTLIEEIAILSARNAFARRSVDEQLDTLHAIRDGVSRVRSDVTAEFNETLKTLDEAHKRLEKTLAALRKTVVDPSLHQSGAASTAEEDGELYVDADESDKKPKEKTLFDFIDSDGHQDLVESLHRLIDEFHEADGDIKDSLNRFDEALRQIDDTLHDASADPSESGPQNKPTIYDEPPPAISTLFRGMENHAVEMAHLLHSLTSHYDLCVNALKHTEGGGEAARRAIQQADELSTKSAGAVEESLYRKTVPEPIDEQHRAEMLRVLESDAEQLDDVIAELKDYDSEIDGEYEQLSNRARASRRAHQALREVLGLMHQMKAALPGHVAASKLFRESWLSICSAMQYKTKELADLTEFYASFSTSYSKVLDEVERRKTAEAQMQKLATKVQKEMDRLYQIDQEARQEFMDGVREYLPRDIWPGAAEGGVRWEVKPVRGKGTEW